MKLTSSSLFGRTAITIALTLLLFSWWWHSFIDLDPALSGQVARESNQFQLLSRRLQAEPDRYVAQLREILGALQETGAVLVFATTTPVPDAPVRPFRSADDVVLYNQLAVGVMREEGVRINDLFAFASPRLSQIQNERDVHFSKAGSEALATQVVDAILAAHASRR